MISCSYIFNFRLSFLAKQEMFPSNCGVLIKQWERLAIPSEEDNRNSGMLLWCLEDWKLMFNPLTSIIIIQTIHWSCSHLD